MKVDIKENERIDDLQRNGLRIIQSPDRFCFGMDAVVLSGFVRAAKGNNLLDLGTGTGILPILLSAKTECGSLTGLEIQQESAEMARRSVALNDLQDRVKIVDGDICHVTDLFPKASFQVVTCNPPYMQGNDGAANPSKELAIARHEILCTLEDVIGAAEMMLESGGRFYMVHRPFRLAEIITVMSAHHLEPKRIRFVHPYVSKEPTMVLIEGMRGAKPRVTIEPPLILYDEPGKYSAEVRESFGF